MIRSKRFFIEEINSFNFPEGEIPQNFRACGKDKLEEVPKDEIQPQILPASVFARIPRGMLPPELGLAGFVSGC